MHGLNALPLKITLLALAYFTAGKLSLLLAIPPGFATPVWPAAGIALAATLLWGYRCLPGVFLGSFATNLLIASQAGADITALIPILIATGIALGAALQAAVATHLVKRTVEIPGQLSHYQDLLSIALRGAVIGCLINATLGPLTLVAAGVMPGSIYWLSSFTWWVGDAIGVVLFTPMLLLLANNSVSYIRKSIVSLPILIFSALTVFLFFQAKEEQVVKKQSTFDQVAQQISTEYHKEINTYLDILTANEQFILASDYVSFNEFKLFTKKFLEKYPSIYSLSWNPKVTHAERETFEQSLQAQGFPDFVIKDRIALGKVEPAQARDLYFPVGYATPYESNKAAVGFDTYGPDDVTDNIRRKVLNQARNENQPIATGRIALVQAENQYGLIIYNPVFAQPAREGGAFRRSEHLLGYTAGVFVVPSMLTSISTMAKGLGADLILRDLSAKPGKQILFDSRTPDFQEPKSPITLPENALQSSITFELMGHQWELEFIQNAENILVDQGWDLWHLLIGGLLSSAMFGVLLIIFSARTELIRQQVEEKTVLSSESIDFKLVSKIAGTLSIALGFLVLLGWYTKTPSLIQIHPSFVPMQYNTALGFLLSGMGLVALSVNLVYSDRGANPLLRSALSSLPLLCGVLLAGLGGLTLLQYILGLNFGIDQLLMEHYITVDTSHPGRMAPNTALCFLLTGLTWIVASRLLRLDGKPGAQQNESSLNEPLKANQKTKVKALRVLGGVIFVLGSIAFFGYLLSFESAYGWLNLTRMAVHTAVGFMIIGVGTLVFTLTNVSVQWSRFLPACLALLASITALIFSAALWLQFDIQEQRLAKSLVDEKAHIISQRLHDQLKGAATALQRMAQRWSAASGTPQSEWISDARNYVEDLPGLAAVEWVDSTFHIRWVEPLQGNEQVVGMSVAFDDKRTKILLKAQLKESPTLTAPFEVVQGYRAFIVYVPVFVEDQFDGFMVGLFNTDDFLAENLPDQFANHFEIMVIDSSNENAQESLLAQHRVEAATDRTLLVTRQLSLFGREWETSIYPTMAFVAKYRTFLPMAVLLGGVLFSLMIGVVVYMAIIASRRNRQLSQQSQALIESEARINLVLENAGEGIYGLDTEGCTTFANTAAINILGYSLEEMINVSQHDLIHHSYPDGTPYKKECCSIYAAFKEGEICSEDSDVFWHKDGHAIPVEYTSAPLRGNNGEITGAVVVFRDISDRKAIEAERATYTHDLEVAKDEAMRANMMKSEFLANMSHEIRTPLNGVIGAAHLLKRTDISDAQDKYVNIITGSGQTLLALINDILDLSKIEAGELKINPEIVVVKPLMESVLQAVTPKAEAKNIKLNVDYQGNIPRSVLADSTRLNQILLNLLGNAVKFVEAGSISLLVEELGREAGQIALRVSITDTGIGIPEDKLELIFNKFEQADGTTTKKYGGTGLGLAITKKLIELMGGTIQVKSTVGVGTTFWFEVGCPVVEEAQQLSSETREESGVSGVSEAGAKNDAAGNSQTPAVYEPLPELNANILLVENERINQVVAMDMLEDLGCHVDLAENGEEALDMLKEGDNEYDVILMDCMMPIMDGYEATKAIRAYEQRIGGLHQTIIAMTANAMAEERRICLEVGMDDYLAKPVEEERLFEKIKSYLDKAS